MDAQVKIKDYDRDAHALKVGLALCEVGVNYDTAYFLSEFIKLYNEKGNKISIDDASDLKRRVDITLSKIKEKYKDYE